jgi:hypothetical protein
MTTSSITGFVEEAQNVAKGYALQFGAKNHFVKERLRQVCNT